jgi:Response regulator of the LytR/AlgR family
MFDIIYIKVRQTTHAVRMERILYMEKRRRQITVHFTEGEDICFYGKYDEVMSQLDGRFVHPHQSYIINMQWIYRLGQQEAVMYGGDRIAMGIRCFSRLRKAYNEYIRDNIRSRPDYQGR